ncbi:hypothetical protein WJX79_001734 [Trebouxia sp. C0005]
MSRLFLTPEYQRHPLSELPVPALGQPNSVLSSATQEQIAVAAAAVRAEQQLSAAPASEYTIENTPGADSPAASPEASQLPEKQPAKGKSRGRGNSKLEATKAKGKEDTVDKASWSKEEEVMLIHEHGKARANGVFARVGTWEHKYQKVTEVLNKNFHRSNPGKYPHLRHAKAVYEKHKNMMNRYKQEQKKKEAWDARKHAAENRQTQTGSATGEDLEDFQSDWHCYDDFFQYCVGGNPADEGQQDAYGHVRQSSLQQQADTTTPGGSKSPVHENVAANRMARNKQKKTEGATDFMTATARPNAQPDLCPRLQQR